MTITDVQHCQSPCASLLCVFGAEFWAKCPVWRHNHLPAPLSVSLCPAEEACNLVIQIFTSSRFFKYLEKTRKPIKQESMFNQKGAQGKTYLLQTIHLYTLYDICIDKAVVLWCLPAAVLQGILHIPQHLYSVHPHYRLFLALLNTSQDANPFHLMVQILSIQGT